MICLHIYKEKKVQGGGQKKGFFLPLNGFTTKRILPFRIQMSRKNLPSIMCSLRDWLMLSETAQV